MGMNPSSSIAASCLLVIRALLVVPCSSAAAQAVQAVHVESIDSKVCQSAACAFGKRSSGHSAQSRLPAVARGAEEDATAEDALALEMRVELLQLDLLPQEHAGSSSGSPVSRTYGDTVVLPNDTERSPASRSPQKAGSQNSRALGTHAEPQVGEHARASRVAGSKAVEIFKAKRDNISGAEASPLQAEFDITHLAAQDLQRNNGTGNRSGEVHQRLNTTAAQKLIQQTLLQTLSNNAAIDSLLTGARQRMEKVSSEINETATSSFQDRLGSFEAAVTSALDESLDSYELAAEGVGNETESLANLLVSARHEAAASALAVSVNKSFIMLDEALDSLEKSRLQLRGLSKRHAAQEQFAVLDQLLANGESRMAAFSEKLDLTFSKTFGYLELLAGLHGTGTFDPLRLKVKNMAESFTSSYMELHSGIASAKNHARVMMSRAADRRTIFSVATSLALLMHSFAK